MSLKSRKMDMKEEDSRDFALESALEKPYKLAPEDTNPSENPYPPFPFFPFLGTTVPPPFPEKKIPASPTGVSAAFAGDKLR
ncbi:hypothetical protein CEXT_462131 [Caerostris extrusa]|uniref:Uncharacterized protein n=1 Tax=Caerostris extrusa TaxID=172846 RepID=A0AAV4P880_CAEEX|nr:hypothetical protein CEXT_462131 [Caerostris extrusa]